MEGVRFTSGPTPNSIRLIWDPPSDTIIVRWNEAGGAYEGTSDARVWIETDEQGNVIGFMIEGVTKAPDKSTAHIGLTAYELPVTEPSTTRLTWDPVADSIVVTWTHDIPGVFCSTTDDRVMVKVDKDDNVIGFMIEGVMNYPGRSPAEIQLKPVEVVIDPKEQESAPVTP